MVKEVKAYEASDGKSFKSKKGAENHEKRIQVKKVTELLNMSEEDIAKKLAKAAKYNKKIAMFLKLYPEWTKWPTNLITSINEDLLKEPKKKTTYVFEYKDWGQTKENVLAVEFGEEFADEDKFCADEYKVYKMEQEDGYNKKVFYQYALSWEERIAKKLESGEKLSEDEISELAGLDPVYQEEGSEGRWDRQMTTVVKLLDDHYAINWSRGLTESQENSFYEQPYLAEIEVKDVVVSKTFINPIKK